MGQPRLEELRRRVAQDPASIAFAQLAEEHRRAGEAAEAVRVCRAGLARHPGYLSARVTLGRALIELGEYDAADAELAEVLRAAPDNLAAIRARAELHQRRDAVETPERALLPVPSARARQAPALPDLDSVFRATDERFTRALESLSDALDADFGRRAGAGRHRHALAALEKWLHAIQRDRAARARA